jgi:hypothetical protein
MLNKLAKKKIGISFLLKIFFKKNKHMKLIINASELRLEMRERERKKNKRQSSV